MIVFLAPSIKGITLFGKSTRNIFNSFGRKSIFGEIQILRKIFNTPIGGKEPLLANRTEQLRRN
jgi:hypothetical protein